VRRRILDGVGERCELDERVRRKRDHCRSGYRKLSREFGRKRAFRHGDDRRAEHHRPSSRRGPANLYVLGESHVRGHNSC
jgi:hypothetical protein